MEYNQLGCEGYHGDTIFICFMAIPSGSLQRGLLEDQPIFIIDFPIKTLHLWWFSNYHVGLPKGK